MTTPHVEVYATLPKVVHSDRDSFLDPNNWHWVHFLSIPNSEFSDSDRFATIRHPHKLIRYAIGVVVGAEGTLSSTPDLIITVTETEALPSSTISLYYHLGDDEKWRMYPLDPLKESRSTSSVTTPRRARFEDEVAARDQHCVLTGHDVEFCRATHLLARSKGDEYISNFTRKRSRDPNFGDFIEAIDDVRNGIMLNTTAHQLLGIDLAFLKTPNFAMDSSDVDSNTTPNQVIYTSYRFTTPPTSYYAASTPSNHRFELASPNQPPDILLDAIFASAIMHHYGVPNATQEVNAVWGNHFYPEIKVSRDADAMVNSKGADIRQERADRRSDRRNADLPDMFDVMLFLPYLLTPPEDLQAAFEQANLRARQAKQQRAQEKVYEWMSRTTA